MNNPLKKQAVAMLCTNVLRNGLSLPWRKTGPSKKEIQGKNKGKDLRDRDLRSPLQGFLHGGS
jgi:hypothetical protein